MSNIRVLIVDDQEILRRGLRMLLELEEGIDVVGEAGNGNEALALIPKLAPHVVLADARMPVLDGLGLVQRCAVSHPAVKVLVLTTFDDASLVRSMFEAGVVGFLLKDVTTDALCAAIRQVVDGGTVIDPRVAGSVIRGSRKPSNAPQLSASEQAVAELISRGLSNAVIAEQLHLAHGTVKNAVSALLRKFSVNDRTALALILAQLERS